MSKTFSCTFLTQAHHDETLDYAREYKHMTLSEFARFAMNEYRKKYPWKGVGIGGTRGRRRRREGCTA